MIGLLAIGLTGCATGVSSAGESPSPVPVPTVTVTVTITPTPEPEAPVEGDLGDPNATHVYNYEVGSDGIAIADLTYYFPSYYSPTSKSYSEINYLMPTGQLWKGNVRVTGAVPQGETVLRVIMDSSATYVTCRVLLDGVEVSSGRLDNPGTTPLECGIPAA
jgi:hypothetical protein